jgi:hypothetical protein
LEILAGQIPDKPDPALSEVDGSDVKISWVAPDDGGSEILGYRVYIRTDDLSTYTLELTNCNGADALIIGMQECNVPILTLRSEPFNLPWGSDIYVKLIAYNIYGDSDISDPANGAVILTYPDAPINVLEVYSERTATSLGLSW